MLAVEGALQRDALTPRTEVRPATCCCTQAEHKAAKRLVAVGDLHGDYDKTRRALRLSGLIDNADHWVGGNTVVVQVAHTALRIAYRHSHTVVLLALA